MNNTIYSITYTVDRVKYNHDIIPALNPSDAYVALMTKHPDAEITELKASGKVMPINSEAWLDVFAKYLVKNAKLTEITDLMDELTTEDARDELVEAIWKQYHKDGGKNV